MIFFCFWGLLVFSVVGLVFFLEGSFVVFVGDLLVFEVLVGDEVLEKFELNGNLIVVVMGVLFGDLGSFMFGDCSFLYSCGCKFLLGDKIFVVVMFVFFFDYVDVIGVLLGDFVSFFFGIFGFWVVCLFFVIFFFWEVFVLFIFGIFFGVFGSNFVVCMFVVCDFGFFVEFGSFLVVDLDGMMVVCFFFNMLLFEFFVDVMVCVSMCGMMFLLLCMFMFVMNENFVVFGVLFGDLGSFGNLNFLGVGGKFWGEFWLIIMDFEGFVFFFFKFEAIGVLLGDFGSNVFMVMLLDSFVNLSCFFDGFCIVLFVLLFFLSSFFFEGVVLGILSVNGGNFFIWMSFGDVFFFWVFILDFGVGFFVEIWLLVLIVLLMLFFL